ncbi:MAG TPA: cytochrome P450 [Pirellulales bacterium]|nr:cytochrome P450 [Pirellulales bacterium]
MIATEPTQTKPTRHPPRLLAARLCPPWMLFHMMYRPLKYLLAAGEKHDIVRLGWIGAPFYLVTQPELIKQMLGDPKKFHKGSLFKKLQIVLGKGLVTLDGQAWIDARRRVQQAFRPGLLSQQQEIVIRHTSRMIERLRERCDGSPVDLDAITTELMLRVALELLFGATPDAIDLDEARHAVDTCNAYARYRIWSLTPETWNTPRKRKFQAALATLESVVNRVIDERRGETKAERGERCDVLSLLFEAGFEGVELRDHVMTMFVAGHETTAGSVAFLLGLLARHPETQAELHQEVRDLPPDSAPLDALPLTEAVWKETLRLFPSVPMMDRTVSEGVQLGEYSIPAGANLIWSPYLMHRKYFADPESFEPRRFLDGAGPAPGTYLPFGEGPRMCIGKALADMEGLTITALVAKAFEVRPAAPGPLTVQPMITLRPKDGFLVRLRPRAEQAVLSPGGGSDRQECRSH